MYCCAALWLSLVLCSLKLHRASERTTVFMIRGACRAGGLSTIKEGRWQEIKEKRNVGGRVRQGDDKRKDRQGTARQRVEQTQRVSCGGGVKAVMDERGRVVTDGEDPTRRPANSRSEEASSPRVVVVVRWRDAAETRC